MLDALPKGWVRTTLGEVCLPVATIQPEDSPSTEFTYFDIGGINNQTNTIAETKTIGGRNAPGRARQAVHKGDILFSTVRTYLRKIARVEQDYPNPVASTGFTVIRAAEGVSSQFLFYQILSEDFLQPLHVLQTGGSYPAVRDRDVFAQPILLPPAAEQERIVAKLNATLSGVQRAETASHRAQARLQSYRAAVLNAAVTGELTRDWRETQRKQKEVKTETGQALLQRLLAIRRARWEEAMSERLHTGGKKTKHAKWKPRYLEPIPAKTKNLANLPDSWTWASMEQISTRVTVGHVGSMKNEYVESGVPFLRSQNVRPNRFEPQGLLFISPQFHARLAKSRIFPGDVVIVRSGSVGTTCVIPDSLGEANCSDLVLVQRPLIEPQFIAFYMNSAARKQVDAGKVGIALTHFNTASVASLAIPLPPVKEQVEIVREVEHRLDAADKLAIMLDRQLERASAARQSLLREAFTGHIVPQNPMDESASVLLGRIRAAREAEAQKPKGKRMPKSKSLITRRPLLDVLRENERPMKLEHLFNEAGFKASQVDLFYRELASLRDKLKVDKPKDSDAKSWPYRAHVMLQLKES